MRDPRDEVIAAVMYALRSGCFFPVREPKPTAGTQAWIKWGAMRNLHDKIAAACQRLAEDVLADSTVLKKAIASVGNEPFPGAAEMALAVILPVAAELAAAIRALDKETTA